MLIVLHHLNKFLLKLSFISDENLRAVIYRAINQDGCAISTIGAVACCVQNFIMITVFLVLENSIGVGASQLVHPLLVS